MAPSSRWPRKNYRVLQLQFDLCFDARAEAAHTLCRMALKKERSPYRTVTYVAIFFLTLYVFGFFRRRPLGVEDGGTGSAAPLPALLKSQQKKDFNSLFMTEKQCRASFPLLNKEIEDRVANGHFKLDRADDYMGLTQGRIKDGKVSQRGASWTTPSPGIRCVFSSEEQGTSCLC